MDTPVPDCTGSEAEHDKGLERRCSPSAGGRPAKPRSVTPYRHAAQCPCRQRSRRVASGAAERAADPQAQPAFRIGNDRAYRPDLRSGAAHHPSTSKASAGAWGDSTPVGILSHLSPQQRSPRGAKRRFSWRAAGSRGLRPGVCDGSSRPGCRGRRLPQTRSSGLGMTTSCQSRAAVDACLSFPVFTTEVPAQCGLRSPWSPLLPTTTFSQHPRASPSRDLHDAPQSSRRSMKERSRGREARRSVLRSRS